MDLMRFLSRQRRMPADTLQDTARWFFSWSWLQSGQGLKITRQPDGVSIGLDPDTAASALPDERVAADDADPEPGYLDAKVQSSLTVDTTNHALQLVGDVEAPGADHDYGTNAAGTRGYQPLTEITVHQIRYNAADDVLEGKAYTIVPRLKSEGEWTTIADFSDVADPPDDSGGTTPYGAGFVAANSDKLTNSGLATGSSSFSVSYWFKHNGVTGTVGAVSKMDNSGGWYVGPTEAQLWDGDGYTVFELSGSPFDGLWHHLVTTIDPGTNTVTAYMDGSSRGVTPTDHNDGWPGGSVPSSANFRLCGRDAGDVYYDMSLDEVSFWTGRVLDGDDAAELYNGGAPVPYADMSAGIKASMTSHWPLDEPSDATRNDVHGSNHLTNVGGVDRIVGVAS